MSSKFIFSYVLMESFSKLSELTTVLPDLEILFQFAITVTTVLAISIEHF